MPPVHIILSTRTAAALSAQLSFQLGTQRRSSAGRRCKTLAARLAAGRASPPKDKVQDWLNVYANESKVVPRSVGWRETPHSRMLVELVKVYLCLAQQLLVGAFRAVGQADPSLDR